MCRQSSVLNKIAFPVLIFGFLASALSFSAPFWVSIPDTLGGIAGLWEKVTYRGLWAMCCPNNQQTTGYTCTWVWNDYYAPDEFRPPCQWVQDTNFLKPEALPAWYQAAQIIFCVAIGFLFISIVLESTYVCCRCCKNPTCFPTVVASLACSGAILVGLSLGIYGGFSYKEGAFAPQLAGGKAGQLEWAFYVGIAGAGTCFIAGVLFFIDGCLETKHYRGYKAPVLGSQ